MNPDGSDKHSLGIRGGHPSWSPDGKQIVFERGREGPIIDSQVSELFVVNADGSGLRQLTEFHRGFQILLRDQYPSWSPDGRWIAFNSNRDGGADIFIIDPSGDQIINLTNTPETPEFMPDWSPNGQEVVYAADGHFYTIRLVDKQRIRLTDNPVNGGYPTWSPDGTQIAFASERNENPDLFVIDADGNKERCLTFRPERDWNPSWSPDGTELVFQTSPQGGPGDIYRLTIVTGDIEILTGENDLARHSPDWSGAARVPRSIEPRNLKWVGWGALKIDSTRRR